MASFIREGLTDLGGELRDTYHSLKYDCDFIFSRREMSDRQFSFSCKKGPVLLADVFRYHYQQVYGNKGKRND